MNNNHCPECEKDIGFFAVFKAGLPSLIKCPFCKTAVKYNSFPWVVMSVCVFIYVFLLYFTFIAFNQFTLTYISMEVIVEITALLVLWIPFEIAIVFYLRKNYKIELK
ncbi:MAG: hypothetical protein HRU38_02825 [Saccharospirillaceae bacterium]|nr:hypothetical protein [Pseudomonadales bacterium]NRB77596.1 hypothetical protein [Saccharospirillaceae bacterium]